MQMGASVIHVYAKQNTFAHLRKVCMCASLPTYAKSAPHGDGA